MSTAPFTEKLSFLDRVNAWKREHYGENCEDASMARVVAQFNEIWERKQALEQQITDECNVPLKALSDIGLEILKANGMEDATVNGVPVWIVDKTRFSILGKKDSPEKKENLEKFNAWAKKHKVLEYIYIEVFNHKRFESVVRGQLDEGNPVPDGVKISPDRVLCVNKRQPGKSEEEREEV